jgi:hypothetical protein
MKLYALLNIILCFSGTLCAQVINDAATIEFGSKNLSLDQPLLISVVLTRCRKPPGRYISGNKRPRKKEQICYQFDQYSGWKEGSNSNHHTGILRS